MARQKQYVTASIPQVAAGSVAVPITGGADVPDFNPRTARQLTGCFISPQTAGVRLRIYDRQSMIAEVDSAAFSAAKGFLSLDIMYDPGLLFHVEIANTTNAAYGPSQVSLEYEVDVT